LLTFATLFLLLMSFSHLVFRPLLWGLQALREAHKR
jgi:hypothetical protein